MAAPANAAQQPSAAVPDLTQLELRLFLHNNEHIPLFERVAKLETLVFGEPCNGEAVERSLRLMKIIPAQQNIFEFQMRIKGIRIEDQAPSAQCESTGLLDDIRTLERQVFNQINEEDSLLGRIERLESKIFPRLLVSRDEPLHHRVGRIADRLEDLAEAQANLSRREEAPLLLSAPGVAFQ